MSLEMGNKILELGENEIENVQERANYLMEFILNRALQFDAKKYSRITVVLENNEKGLVLYNVLSIVAMFRGIPIKAYYDKKPVYWNKGNRLIERVRFFCKYEKLRRMEDSLVFCTWTAPSLSSVEPMIFKGITNSQVALIARELYGWEER